MAQQLGRMQLQSRLVSIDSTVWVQRGAILGNISSLDFWHEAVLKECRMEGLHTLFCLTVIDYQGNVHLLSLLLIIIALFGMCIKTWFFVLRWRGMNTLDAPCEIICTLTPFLRRTLNAWHAATSLTGISVHEYTTDLAHISVFSDDCTRRMTIVRVLNSNWYITIPSRPHWLRMQNLTIGKYNKL